MQSFRKFIGVQKFKRLVNLYLLIGEGKKLEKWRLIEYIQQTQKPRITVMVSLLIFVVQIE